jgi:hypothetical protein
MWPAAHRVFPLIVPFDLGGAVFLQASHYNQDHGFFQRFPKYCCVVLVRTFSYGVGMVSNCSSFSRCNPGLSIALLFPGLRLQNQIRLSEYLGRVFEVLRTTRRMSSVSVSESGSKSLSLSDVGMWFTVHPSRTHPLSQNVSPGMCIA